VDDHPRGRNDAALWGLLLLSVAYGSLFRYLHTLLGTNVLEGAVGVVLGLYICSHPAANAVDILFFHRVALHPSTSRWSDFGWLALNVMVLLAGWLVIVLGATRLVS
jgi:hypothetical protein